MARKEEKKVSISGIFKHGTRKHTRPSKTAQTYKNVMCNALSYEPVKGSKNGLAEEFSEKLEFSRIEILRNATTGITFAHHTLLERLASTSANAATFLDEATQVNGELARPLAEERLQFTGRDGKPSGTVRLHDRMKGFCNKVAREEKELSALWKEWIEMQRLIYSIGNEILDSGEIETLVKNPPTKVEDLHRKEATMVAHEINVERKKIAEEIETMGGEFIDKMNTSEKELDIRTNKQRQEFLVALGASY